MRNELVKMALPPHRRIDLRRQIKERAAQIGVNLSDLGTNSNLLDSEDQQPTSAEMVRLAVRLRCGIDFTDLRLVPDESRDGG
jgi:hypothetical protein